MKNTNSIKNRKNLNVYVVLLFSILFILSLSTKVLSQVTIQTVEIPAQISENSNLEIYFDASTDTNNSISYSIYKNGVLVSSSNTYSETMDYYSNGTYEYTIQASDGESIESENYTLIVEDVPITLQIISPTANTYGTRNIPINISTSSSIDSCEYTINGTSYSSFTNYAETYYALATLTSDGVFNLLVTCENSYETVTLNRTFTVDTINPIISSKSYSISENNVVTLNVVTDRTTTCKYDTSEKKYDSLSYTFTNTNSLQHSTSINGLNDGSYAYYIRCKSFENNISSNYDSISFSMVIKPTAQISIDKDDPLKSGTYTVEVTTSESIQNSPTLYYTLDNDQTAKYVSLTGSGTVWRGYMIIDENVGNRIGTFHFNGKDMSNNVGTTITSGEIFLIDSEKPVAPQSVDAVSRNDGSIQIKWYYPQDDNKRFNIYRSTSGSVDYVDYYDESEDNYYIDRSVIEGITYYYKVAAVDDAGNDGELSTMVGATSEKIITMILDGEEEVLVVKQLSPELVPKVDQQISEFNNILLDIGISKVSLSQINDPSKLTLISLLKLSDKITSAENTINTLISQTSELKKQDLTNSELDIRLNKLRLEAIKATSEVVEDLSIQEQSTYEQITQTSDVNEVVSIITKDYNLSKKALKDYSQSNILLQDSITVDSQIFLFKIKYMGKDDYNTHTLVRKKVTADSEMSGVVILENIPKSFESLASNILFIIADQKQPVIVQEDPVVKWDVESLNSQYIYYMIDGAADMTAAKSTKTIVLNKPDFKISDAQSSKDINPITGFVGLESVNLNNFSMVHWIIFLGVAMILGLLGYSASLSRIEKKRKVQRVTQHKIIPQNSVKQSVQTSTPISQISVKTSVTQNNANINPNTLLEEANSLINNFNYEKARQVYNLCMKQNNSDMDKQMLHHVYIKLSIYRLIYATRKEFNSKEYFKARKDLINLNELYIQLIKNIAQVNEDNKLPEQRFLDYVSNSKKHLESMAS